MTISCSQGGSVLCGCGQVGVAEEGVACEGEVSMVSGDIINALTLYPQRS